MTNQRLWSNSAKPENNNLLCTKCWRSCDLCAVGRASWVYKASILCSVFVAGLFGLLLLQNLISLFIGIGRGIIFEGHANMVRKVVASGLHTGRGADPHYYLPIFPRFWAPFSFLALFSFLCSCVLFHARRWDQSTLLSMICL